LIKNGQHYEEVYKGIVLCVACTQGSYHLATEWSKQVNGRTIFFKKRRHLRQKLRKNIMFLSDLFQFGVFPPLLFFFSYGTEQWCVTADRCNKQHKKAVEGS